MIEKLLPCPFCGSKELRLDIDENNMGDAWETVMCLECAGKSYGSTEEEAKEAWNKRAESNTINVENQGQRSGKTLYVQLMMLQKKFSDYQKALQFYADRKNITIIELNLGNGFIERKIDLCDQGETAQAVIDKYKGDF